MKKILILLIILTLSIIANAEDSLTVSIDDGPYVSIENDTTINVQYVLQGSLVTQKNYGNDMFSFSGKGFDSNNNYRVALNHPIEEFLYSDASKIFVFSDIHGEYEFLVELLINNNIVDSNLNWKFGNGHLVVDGDIPDRGDKVTEILWLVYKLSQQADLAGGKVHYLLGNHEIMPLQNDLRYINEKYQHVANLLDKDSSYANLFSNQTVLGNWIRSKNICEIINGILFVHAGISPKMMHNQYSLAFINETMRANIDTPRKSIKADTTLTNLFSSFGPIWYRGYHYDMEKYKQVTMPEVDSLLEYYKVSNIIVGHTVKDSTAVLYDGKIFGVNQDYEIHDEIEGMYIENGIFFACDINGVRRQIHSNK